MSVADCEKRLRQIASELRPILARYGFAFDVESVGEGHGAFASGFFTRADAKIGIICRGAGTLGAVIYENEQTNASHDSLMSWLGFSNIQKLHYDEHAFASVAEDDRVVDALRADFSALGPTLADPGKLAIAIMEARSAHDGAARDSGAADQAKLKAWLARRRKKQ